MNPLSADEVNALDATVLPALERHHLRLLAHALRTLQQIQQDRGQPGLPPRAAIADWLLLQPSLGNDHGFASTLAGQLEQAGVQLQQLAESQGRSALELQLNDLIRWARAQADQRLATDASAPPPEPPATPPTAR